MKKSNGTYILKWYGGAFLIAAALIAVAFIFDLFILAVAAFMGFCGALGIIPEMLGSRMEKKALLYQRPSCSCMEV